MLLSLRLCLQQISEGCQEWIEQLGDTLVVFDHHDGRVGIEDKYLPTGSPPLMRRSGDIVIELSDSYASYYLSGGRYEGNKCGSIIGGHGDSFLCDQ